MAIGQHQTRIQTLGSTFLQSLTQRAEWQLAQERERLALWLPVLFGLGIALFFIFPSKMAWIGAMAIAAGAILCGGMIGLRFRLGQVCVSAGAAVLLGVAFMWTRSILIAAPILAYPVTTEFSARVSAVELLSARGKVRLYVTPVERPDLPPLLRLTATEAQARDIRVAEYVGLRARLQPPPKANLPGGYDFARRAWFDGIGAIGSVQGEIMRAPVAERSARSTTRARLTDHIHDQVKGSAGGVAAALVTGDRGAIGLADDEAMRRSGLAHLLSISGLHVTAVVGFTMLASLRLFGLLRGFALGGFVVPAAAAMAALVGGGYTLLAGAEVPTLRSFIAALLILAAILMGREAITLRLVAAGAILVLLWRPEALIGPSFQLSFAAVATIVALHELPAVKNFLARRDEGTGAKIGREAAGLLLTGLAVEIALMPIGMFHFHKAGIYGALANMIAIPLTTFIVMPAEAAALFLDVAGLGAPFWWVADTSIKAMLGLAHWVASAPASVHTISQVPPMSFGLMIGGGLWLLLWSRSWRLWGLVPIVLGLILLLAAPEPDLIIGRDGRQVAVRVGAEEIALLRTTRSVFSRDSFMEMAGVASAPLNMDAWPGAECNEDFCRWTQGGDDRKFTMLASRSNRMADYRALISACHHADIVISDRRMPKDCRPRFLLADREALASSGGMILYLAETPTIEKGDDDHSDHPWQRAEQVSGNDER